MDRIFFFNRRYCPGEAWTNRVLAYARGFAEKGVEVILCYLIGDKNRSEYKIDIPGVEVVNFWEKDFFLARRCRYVSLLFNLIRCRRYIKSSDIVFVYGAESYLLQMALSKTRNVFAEITEHPYMNDKSGNKILPNWRRKQLNKLKSLFVISNALQNYFFDQGISMEKVHVSNMFVDADRFAIRKEFNGEKYFAYCGVVSKYKDGVNDLLNAFALFHKHHSDYKLYIIGRFESLDIKKELEAQTDSLSITERVVFTGQVSPNEMPCLLSNAEALVLARPDNLQSKYGFPTKLGEYLATGNPVIVTNVGEIGNFIENKRNGILVPPNAPEAFADGMLWVVEHPQEAAVIGKKGQELAKTAFSYKTQSEKVLKIMLESSR